MELKTLRKSETKRGYEGGGDEGGRWRGWGVLHFVCKTQTRNSLLSSTGQPARGEN